MQSFADRSRVLTFQSCPRKRYLEYEIQTGGEVGGVRPVRLDMNLILGSTFHAGIEKLLHAAMVGFSVSETAINYAIDYALSGGGDWTGFWPSVKSMGLQLDSTEDASYVYYEQAALAEALIRGYAAFVLPQLLERFQVVDVEREEVGTFTSADYVLKFGARVDGILLEKDTLNIYVLSLKTSKEWGKRDDDSARHDMQGLSECRVVEQRLQLWHAACEEHGSRVLTGELSVGVPKWFWDRFVAGGPPLVTGVKMEFALKGRRENSPKGSGTYKYNNPLIRPWKKADDLGGAGYAISYEFTDPMGGNHRLGKGWNRVNIWEDMGVKKWIEYVGSHEIQGFAPGTALMNQFVLPVEYFRNAEDMDRWERQVVAQERRIAQAHKEISLGAVGGVIKLPKTPQTFEAALDEHFPMHTKACDWPTKCSFQEVCFGPAAYLHDPIASQLYQIRVPNHKTELNS